MKAQAIAQKLVQHYPTKQLKLLASKGNCWWDLLLDELLSVKGFSAEVRALTLLAFKEMKTEMWTITMECVRHQQTLQRIEKADSAELLQIMREST
jgi:hypothetical protein